MVEQSPNPSYSSIMKELDIEILSPICHSNPINTQKPLKIWKNEGFRIAHLTNLRFQDNQGILLRYDNNEFSVFIFLQKQGKEEFTHK